MYSISLSFIRGCKAPSDCCVSTAEPRATRLDILGSAQLRGCHAKSALSTNLEDWWESNPKCCALPFELLPCGRRDSNLQPQHYCPAPCRACILRCTQAIQWRLLNRSTGEHRSVADGRLTTCRGKKFRQGKRIWRRSSSLRQLPPVHRFVIQKIKRRLHLEDTGAAH